MFPTIRQNAKLAIILQIYEKLCNERLCREKSLGIAHNLLKFSFLFSFFWGGESTEENGKRKAESGKRKTENGKQKTENGKRKAESGKSPQTPNFCARGSKGHIGYNGYIGCIKLSTTLPTNYLSSVLCTLYSHLRPQTTTPLISAFFLVRRVADVPSIKKSAWIGSTWRTSYSG